MTKENKEIDLKQTKIAKRHDLLLKDLRSMIEEAREHVVREIDSSLVIVYWKIGHRLRQDILKEKRAEYGKEIVVTVSRQLSMEFGRGFSRANLFHMVRFAEVYPDPETVYALSRQLRWTHFRQIIYIEDSIKRDFYAEMSRVEQWSTRTLAKKIDSMLYERTALSKKPQELAKKEMMALKDDGFLTPDLVFRDPYFLDFLGLKDTYSEKDLESGILRELEAFIMELGVGFSFVARQKRITVDNYDYYLDLLFFHRKLQRLVAVELKLGKFKAAYKGQMEFYLRWLEKYEQQQGEKSPLGLILCADKSEEQIELLKLDKGSIRVAAYLTELPPRDLLQKKLHDAIKQTSARLELTDGDEK